MLKLITGKIGSGKTTYMNNIIKECIANNNDCVLIVPEQFSFYTERNMLNFLGAKDADKVEVVSFSFLAQNLLKKYGLNSKKSLDDSTRTLMMSLALEGISDKLKVYGRHRFSTSVITEMLKTIKEFRQCAVSADLIREAARKTDNALLRSKLKEIALISDAYSSLVDASYFDDECALDKMCDVLDAHNNFKNKTV
ncbi:MAG: helicase, partial [Ruminococcus sp.]|nr:helicase [Candidatus Copronaster equi]